MTVSVHREPPTALGVARDLSGSKERASAATEGRTRACWCVCGGLITAASIAAADVLFAVQSHNNGARHQEWRRFNGR